MIAPPEREIGIQPHSVKHTVLITLAVLANTCGNFLLSWGMHQVDFARSGSPWTLLRIFANPWVDAGVLLLVVWLASQLSLLSWADLSYVLPVTAVSYALTALLGKVFLHESVSPGRWMGILLISGGVMLVTCTRPKSETAAEVLP